MHSAPLPKFIFGLIFAALLLAGANRYFFNGSLAASSILPVGDGAAYLFNHAADAGGFFNYLKNTRKLAEENERLQKENDTLRAQIAADESLTEENVFLKRALEIDVKIRSGAIPGNIFSMSMGPAGYDVLLNKGSDDGIKDGAVVISEEGILIGVVTEVFGDSARILPVHDRAFSVTAKVLGTPTAGIAKGGLEKGLSLELIVQSDIITTGDTLVSSGNDHFPAGLLIGTVRDVDIDQSDVFKKVLITSAMSRIRLGKVLVIPRN